AVAPVVARVRDIDVARELRGRWRALPDDAKRPYEERANQELVAEYQRALREMRIACDDLTADEVRGRTLRDVAAERFARSVAAFVPPSVPTATIAHADPVAAPRAPSAASARAVGQEELTLQLHVRV